MVYLDLVYKAITLPSKAVYLGTLGLAEEIDLGDADSYLTELAVFITDCDTILKDPSCIPKYISAIRISSSIHQSAGTCLRRTFICQENPSW